MYNFVCEWEDRERKRERIPHFVTQQTEALLRNADVLKFYEEATLLWGNSSLLQKLIHHWDQGWQAFIVGLDSWYQPTKEDIYFITEFSRRWEDQPQFPKLNYQHCRRYPTSICLEIYYPLDCWPTDFHVVGDQLRIDSFGIKEVRCLSLIVTTLEHSPYDGQCIFDVLCRQFTYEAFTN